MYLEQSYQEIPDKLCFHIMLGIMQIWEVDGIFRYFSVHSVNMFNVWKIGARSS